jgi:hypothetical protein
MASITYWNRLEPDPRSKSLARSLAAEIRDPVWLLTRQWQLGEFRGEDAATPMSVEIETESFDLTTFGPATSPTTVQPDAPLEPQVQREPYTPDLATKVELSQMWARLLPEGFDFEPFRTTYPLPTPQPTELRDDASARFLAFATGRAFDGFRLYLDVRDRPASVPLPDDQAVAEAMREFTAAVEDVFGTLQLSPDPQDPPTWRPETLDYRFDVRARDATREYALVVRPGADGEIDWDAFDLASSAAADGRSTLSTRTLMPTHLRFAGMPSARFWDFESGATNFSEVHPDRRDVAKLLMLDLMLVHGVDWFLVDLPVAVGQLVRVRGLVVRDVFGETSAIPRGEDLDGPPTRRWTVFSVAGSNGQPAGDFFILPASAAGARQHGRTLEEVSFGRDETANMAWAIERAVETDLGESWPGTERAAAFDAGHPAPSVPPTTAPLRYQLGTKVPLHWIPFLPVRVPAPPNQIALVEADVEAAPVADHRPTPVGRVLRPVAAPTGPFSLLEEEVPREGVKVRRLVVRTRWIDGKSYLWVERRRAPGTGETQSGLRFDQALNTT